MKSLGWVLVLLLAILAGAWALANFVFAQTKVRTDRVYGNVREIVVEAGRGDIDLVPARRHIEVRETRHWVVSQPRLEQTRENGVLRIESSCTAERIVLKCHADLRVTVPRGVRVRVEAGSGDVDLRGINVRRARVDNRSGDIDMDLAGRQQLVYATNDSGDIDVVARSARAVDVQSDSGEVTADIGGRPRRVVARSNSGHVAVAVPRGSYRIRAASESGEETVSGLRRNERSLQSVHARTDSGDVTVRAR